MSDVPPAGSFDYLKTQAVSRLYLDNFANIQSSWVTQGLKIGQLAMLFGANDMGSVMMEENVVSAAGTTYCLNEAVLCHLIRTAGFVPAQRNNVYRHLKTHDGLDDPDTSVIDWSAHRIQKLHIEKSDPGEEGMIGVPLTIGAQKTDPAS